MNGRRVTFGFGSLAVVAAITLGVQLSRPDEIPSTPTLLGPLASACRMLDNGIEPERAFDVIEGQYDAVVAARSMNRAIAGDC